MFPTLFTFGFFTFGLGRQFLDEFSEFFKDVSSTWNLRCWYTMNRFRCCFQHFVFTEFCVKMNLTKKNGTSAKLNNELDFFQGYVLKAVLSKKSKSKLTREG